LKGKITFSTRDSTDSICETRTRN